MHTWSRTTERPHAGRQTNESGILTAVPDHGSSASVAKPRFSAIGYGRALVTRPSPSTELSKAALTQNPNRLGVDRETVRNNLGRNLTGLAPAVWAFAIAMGTAATVLLTSHLMLGANSVVEPMAPATPPISQAAMPLAPLADPEASEEGTTVAPAQSVLTPRSLVTEVAAPKPQESESREPTSAVVFQPLPEVTKPTPPPSRWAPVQSQQEKKPTDHLPIPSKGQYKVKVVTIKAKVTAYTAMDHAVSKPEWADGVVAWHPGGKKRRVQHHPYNLATDWSQFPPGATFIRVPGYMDKTFPNAPQSFRVVDDACGRSRRDRRQGRQPVIDVRFRTLYSAINRKNGWGMRELNVEVVYPEGFRIPASVRPWVVKEEWRLFKDGKLVPLK